MARRILIADDTVNNRIAFKAALSAARYDVTAVASAKEAVISLEEHGADLLLIDAALPDLSSSGVLSQLQSDDPSVPPCIVMTSEEKTETRAAWIEAGATAVMARPVDRSWLLTSLRGILRRHETRTELARQVSTARRLGFAEDTTQFAVAPRVVVVGHDRAASGRLIRGLPAQIGYPVTANTPGEILAEAASGSAFDLILLTEGDLEDTLELLSEFRAHPATRRASVIVECDGQDLQRGALALDLGANALLRTDAGLRERAALIIRELTAKRQSDSLRHQLDQSLRLAARDDLTGLFNRRYALQYLADTARRAVESDRSYGVLLVDIDHFKLVNDRLGHATGDSVLKDVATRLKENLREHDLVARFGGEEFLVILSNAAPGEALLAAERLREAVDELRDTVQHVTVSIGVANGDTLDVKSTIALADAALYRAKRDGRNLSRLASQGDALTLPTSPAPRAAGPLGPSARVAG